MHRAQDYLGGLSQLHQLASADERKAVWRQGLAALAADIDKRPTPLEGTAPEALVASVRIALATGLCDDLDWLSKPVAATAIFALAAALPQGREKRELGRRVLQALHAGDASTFVSLARALALGSRRALAGGPVRARVALSLRLPIATGTSADGLALALLSRPELEREWLSIPSTGALPSRRLAARLIERAAREAARRAEEGDDAGLRVFERAAVRTAWGRLLADRESLVWRHVATARGLLSGVEGTRREEIDLALSIHHGQGPTEWRRAAASLAASIAHDPQAALNRCRELASGELLKRDPGVAVAMVHGLTRAGEEEPEAAEELLVLLVERGDLDVMEALVDVRREHVGGEFGLYAAGRALARLRAPTGVDDDGLLALRESITGDLTEDDATRAPTLSWNLSQALLAFAEGRPLRPCTEAALAAASAAMSELEGVGDDSSRERQRAFHALRELDRGLLETSTLSELLTVSGLDSTAAVAAAPADLLERLSQWILKREETPLPGGPNAKAASVPHPVLRLRRLRTLLHLLDFEGVLTLGEEAAQGLQSASRARRLRALRVLLDRIERDPPSRLRRTLCASLARACDALWRDELCELSDILSAISSKVRASADLEILAEASMAPEVKDLFRASAEVARLVAVGSDPTAERTFLDAFVSLAQTLPPGTSPRVEGLRRELLRLGRALGRIYQAQSLSNLRQGDGAAALELCEETLQSVAMLCGAARARLGLGANVVPATIGESIRGLEKCIERAARDLEDDLRAAVRAVVEVARAELPAGIAEVVAKVLSRVAGLPLEASMEINIEWSPAGQGERLRLPPWLPPSRIVGGFYVLRPIGTGGGGSVFVARRSEERHDDNGETFALKIPSFDGQNAHTLSEQEFLQLFREEAGALLTLPQHANLAGFVTFDVRARPKPILVMELVRGPTLERVIDKRELSVPFAFAILDGVAAGLEAMHAIGIGHLDVKPGNIILRESYGMTGSRLMAQSELAPTAVLVDFGLAGRKVRPGCASPYYGAPELWDPTLYQLSTGPASVDVYAYCCLAYELFMGRTLFDGDTLPALISGHLSHNGNPPDLGRLRADRRLAQFAQIIAAGLARDPRRRVTILQLRQALKNLAPALSNAPWPVAA
jgi:eukaryotic-like serine/threonine-protein kinase